MKNSKRKTPNQLGLDERRMCMYGIWNMDRENEVVIRLVFNLVKILKTMAIKKSAAFISK